MDRQKIAKDIYDLTQPQEPIGTLVKESLDVIEQSLITYGLILACQMPIALNNDTKTKVKQEVLIKVATLASSSPKYLIKLPLGSMNYLNNTNLRIVTLNWLATFAALACIFPSLMLSPSPTHCSGELEKQYAFTVAFMVYSSLKSMMKGKTSVPKEVKSIKIKELSFPLKVNNYLDFLQGILNKHGQDHYKVSERKWYSFNAMDVDNEANYQEMVGKVSSIHPSTTKIFFNMKQVRKLPLSESGMRLQKTSSHEATDLDLHLTQWCIKLEQLHKNEHDKGWTYIRPMGPVPLTPAMILDWCHALEEGQAMLHMLPNIESFNITNQATCLHPVHKVQAAQALIHPVPPATPTININPLTSVLLLQTLTKSSLLSSPTPVAPAVPPASSPVTPT
ncbi:hypothetical protein F5141DRAFT_1209871 [Pisolithus sp. B1]|nr:hypothetical protein F5141DRAFT_1209871 [Pisolithus sp. B1]